MPVMNGIELIEALRADRRWSRLPILVFSAASTIAPPAGVPVLPKPVNADLLLSTMRRHLRSQSD
jgi:CheY-like chemotaxis protein